MGEETGTGRGKEGSMRKVPQAGKEEEKTIDITGD